MAKRTKKKRSWSLPKPSLPEFNREDWHRALVTTLMVALVVGLIAAWIVGVPKLEAYAGDSVVVEEIEIMFSDRPAWVDGKIKLMLVRTVLDHFEIDPLTISRDHRGDYLLEIRDALLNTGWFEQVDQVRRVNAERIRIDAAFVIPYAVIREDDGDHLVDVRGRLLPWVFPAGNAGQFMVIKGNRFPRPYRPGMQWEGADIVAAIELQKLIERQPWANQVRAIDVSGYLHGEPMGLITDRGTRIVWGSQPGEEKPLEATVERKLAFLKHHYDNHRHIDAGHAGEIDITSHHAVFQR